MLKQLLGDVEDPMCHLRCILDTLELVSDLLSIEGYQNPGQYSESVAFNFTMRLPTFLSAQDVALRDMRRQLDEMESMFDEYRAAQKSTT